MSNRPPYLSLYPGDILRDTILWTGEQRALLVLLMMYAFATTLPADECELARVVQYDEAHFRKLWPRVRDAFTVENGLLVHADVEQHRARATQLRQQRVEASQKAAEVRKQKAKPALVVIPGGAPSGKPGGLPNG